jgi:UDP-N-acetylglucosamine 4,6-dehydratase/5-epimerase
MSESVATDILRKKTVVVTGGTGSFGHFVVRELLKRDVSRIVVFSRDEEKQLDMRREIPDPRVAFFIGDVRDRERVLETLRADYVYHAAALKIIPTCEENPAEAYKTNLIGTLNVREACIRNNVKKALIVSTDKAVKPVNTYGMTKALSEKLWLAPSRDGPIFTAVRYGNVIGSRGSILPLFKELIAQKKPLPITDPSMTRFLITLKQAIQLVLEATQKAKGGEIFVPKCSACKVTDLIEAMVGKDYPTEAIGIRPGEKITEVLVSEEEFRRTEERKDQLIIHPHGRFHNPVMQSEFSSDNAHRLGLQEIKALLQETGF